MPSDPRQFLHDVVSATGLIGAFVQGRSYQDYATDPLLRSACERQLEIVGEAMTRLRDHHPNVFESISEAREIIGLRNRLIHGYDAVDDAIVWDVISRKLVELDRLVKLLLNNPE